MSGPSTPGANAQGQPKQMSSRLLTMKFMQRASSANQKSTPNRSSSSTYNTPYTTPTQPSFSSEPSSKRQKTDNHQHTPTSTSHTPISPETDAKLFASRQDIQAALSAQSAFEELAKQKRAELGFGYNEYESEWVLSGPLPVTNGYEEGESRSESSEEDDNDEEDEQPMGRQTYGNFKRVKTDEVTSGTGSKTQAPKSYSHSQSHKFDDFESDSDLEEGEDRDGDSEDEEQQQVSPRYGSTGKKGKAQHMLSMNTDETDDVAMEALDRVDLSKTGYARAKGRIGGSGGGGGGGKRFGGMGSSGRDKILTMDGGKVGKHQSKGKGGGGKKGKKR